MGGLRPLDRQSGRSENRRFLSPRLAACTEISSPFSEEIDDSQTEERRVPAVFAKEGRENRQTKESRDVQVPRGRREARTRRSVLQTRLTVSSTRELRLWPSNCA